MIKTVVIHPLWLRVTHWLNAVAVIIMVMSGWRIYNASPLWGFRFPDEVTIGGWLAGALMWHFAAMWLLVVNGFLYLAVNALSGRFRKKFLPLSWCGARADMAAFFKGQLSHDDISRYNAVQKLSYLFVILVIAALVLSGLVMWKPVQFPLLRTLLGDYEVARRIHFFSMSALVIFFVVHVAMAFSVPRSLLAMVRGR